VALRRSFTGLTSPVLALSLAALVGLDAPSAQRAVDTRFPAALEPHIGSVARFSAAERRRLHEGGAVTKLLDSDVHREVAVSGVVWINAPASRYVERFKNIERHENGEGFHVTRRFSVPPRLEDFNDLHLPAEDVEDLRSCRVADCELQLSEHAVNLFHKEVNWTAPDARAAADRVMRRWLYEYVTGYMEGGNERLAVYRDIATPVPVAAELNTLVENSASIATYPELKRYLLEYPRATLPNAHTFFYWQEASFGLKRTFHLSHVVIAERQDETVVMSKMLYATHYFWSALDVRVLVPDPARGNGFWFVTASRSRLDGLTGFTGFFVRRRVRSRVQEGAMKILMTTKRTLENSALTARGR
jgi:hypothetical protein